MPTVYTGSAAGAVTFLLDTQAANVNKQKRGMVDVIEATQMCCCEQKCCTDKK
jgi:hypothetical protein